MTPSQEVHRILIVDTDEQVTTLLSFKLRQLSYEVLSLSSTVNALAAIREFKPHLIISEMTLPELSGIDFLKRIRMNPETARIPFIFLSASRNVEEKILAHEMGAEAFFAKPIFIKALINRINDFFQEKEFREILAPSEKHHFTGLLQNISILDLLNIIHENQRTGLIELTALTGETARIYFANGSPLRIEKEKGNSPRGEENLYALLPWNEGSFTITYGEINATPNITEDFEHLMLNATHWLADYHGGIKEIPPLDQRLFLHFAAFIENLAKIPDAANTLLKTIPEEGTTVGDLIEKGGNDRRKTISHMKTLLMLNVLGISPSSDTPVFSPPPAWFHLLKAPHPSSSHSHQPRMAPHPPLPGEENSTPPPPLEKKTPPEAPASVSQPISSVPEPPQAPSYHAVDDSLLIDSISQEHNETQQAEPSRKSSLVSVAFLTAIIAVGAAIWYFLFSPFNHTSRTPDIPARVEAPDATSLRPPQISGEKEEKREKEDPLKDKKPEELLSLGVTAHAARRYDEAVTFYQAALLRLPPHDPETHQIRAKALKNLAIVFYDTDRYEGALEAILESRAIGDEDPEKVELTAAILEQMGRFKEAVAVYQAAIHQKIFKKQIPAWKKEIRRLKKEEKKTGGTQ